ncbi:hypothetical protein, partial [Streptacidiphilus jiangxiensis]
MSDPIHDTLGDRLRLLGAQTPAPTLPAAEVRRRADRRRRRRYALGATAAVTAAAAVALCLALPSVLHPVRGQQAPAAPDASTVSASPHPRPAGAYTVTSTESTPIGAGAVAEILASCLGSDASQYHPVLAVRAPVAGQDEDGVVVALNSANQYVQCETKGRKGTSQDSPATFINDRLWGTGHLIEYFDSTGEPATGGQYLTLGAGHYAPGVAKVTISFGTDPTQYPAAMAGGAFAYTIALSSGT